MVVISGASSVPGLSSAAVDKYKEEFQDIKKIEHYINPGNQTPRGLYFLFLFPLLSHPLYLGLATIKSVLEYCGKPVKEMINGSWVTTTGWQDSHCVALHGALLIFRFFPHLFYV